MTMMMMIDEERKGIMNYVGSGDYALYNLVMMMDDDDDDQWTDDVWLVMMDDEVCKMNDEWCMMMVNGERFMMDD